MSDIFRDFGKKNEVPKVKIPKFATGGICNDAIFPKFDAFSQIDEIVKDITKKKDNAIAMEFTKYIGELLRKNGVVPKMTEYTRNFETNKTFGTRYGVTIDELDFSAHDKVFEDKIAELEKDIENYKQAFEDKCKDYDFTSELLNKYVAENESLEKRIQELDTIDAMRIDEERELKQRIAELESKEMENFSEINTSNPLACAESLIEHMTHCEKFMIMPERDVQTFSVEELKEIADYLMVYYKHHKDRDAEDTISF